MPVTELRVAVGDWLPVLADADDEVTMGGGIEGDTTCDGNGEVEVGDGLDDDEVVKGGGAPPADVEADADATAISTEEMDAVGGGGGAAPFIVAEISSFFLRNK